MSSTLTPKYIPTRNIFPTASRFPHRHDSSLRTGLRTRFKHWSGLTDPSQPIRFSTCFADPSDVELVTQRLLIADANLDEISRVKFEFAVSFDMKDHSGSLKAY